MGKLLSRIAISVFALLGMLAGVPRAQTSNNRPTFELISIKSVDSSGEVFSSFRVLPRGRFEGVASIHDWIAYAFGSGTMLRNSQVINPPRPAAAPCFVDEGPSDPTLIDFREGLRGIIRARDLTALRPLIATNIVVAKDLRGIAAFERTYQLPDSKTSWQEFEGSLSLPGKLLEPGWFCAPFFNCYGRGRAGYVTVLERDVPIMSEPRAQSRVLEKVSCEELRWAVDDNPVAGGKPDGWIGVLRGAGGVGFIEDRYVGDPNLMFITMQKRNDRWMIVGVEPID